MSPSVFTLRDELARYALERIPKLLTLQDRSPHSKTYGCFDRSYWHLKIKDMPSGMSQEFVWPLALVWSLDLPDNPYRHDPAMRDWIEAGIKFSMRSAHSDGSCDDYFPYEKASGATAFSLLACLHAADIINLADPDVEAFFVRRARWLGRHQESGHLSNHEALIALCLLLVGERADDTELLSLSKSRVDRLMSWQHEEGWFEEYDGCDPGYLTMTVSILAMYRQHTKDPSADGLLLKAADVIVNLMHPDGTLGGEYTSRNTHNYFPHGFELLGREKPDLLIANNMFLQSLNRGLGACYDDDYIIGHHIWSYLLAWRDFATDRPDETRLPLKSKSYPAAGLFVERRDDYSMFLSAAKGGAFVFYAGDRQVTSDTQISIQVRQRKKLRTAVAHLTSHNTVDVGATSIVISGNFSWAKQTLMTPVKMIILRLIMLTGGRFFPNLIRILLQKLLIVGAADAPFRFKREIHFDDDDVRVVDEVRSTMGWTDVVGIGLGSAQTSNYVVMSRVYRPRQHQRWLVLDEVPASLHSDEPLRLERSLTR